jgi:hypothetical protein
MFAWLTMAAYTSILVYFVGLLVWAGERVQIAPSNSTSIDNYGVVPIPLADHHGQYDGLASFGTMIYFCLIATMQCKVLFETNSWNKWTLIFQLVSWLLFFVSIWILDTFSDSWGEEMKGVYSAVFGNINSYLYVCLVMCLLLVTEIFIEHFRLQFSPNAIDITREIDKGYINVAKKQKEHCTSRLHRRNSSLAVKHNSDLDNAIKEAMVDNVDLGIIDSGRRSSYAYDSPTVVSKGGFKPIMARRHTFGRVYDLQEVLNDVDT